ncbi:MAG: radical SAM protein [Candidatus Omnitrophota bacterium]
MRVLLIAYDNGSYIHWFPMGLSYIAAALRNAGHDITIYSQDKYHYPDEHLTHYLDKNKFDMVAVGVIAGYYQYRKLLSISCAVNASRQRPFYVIGGHGPTPEPGFFLKKTRADAVVLGEGDISVVNLAYAVENKKPLEDVKGIAFREGDAVTVNEREELVPDIDTLPFPAYDLFPIDYYRLLQVARSTKLDFVMPMVSGRGCPFKCAFCYRMDEGHRVRKNDSIIEEMKLLKKDYGITYIAFGDELLMSSVERVSSLCESFIKEKLNMTWYCNGRLNYAKPELLKLMSRAGCVFINYGIEALDDEVLRKMNKVLTVSQIVKGIEATLAAGVSPGFNIIFGNVGDNLETLDKGVKFLIKYDDGSQMRTIRPVTPYPGSPLYYKALEEGLLKDCEDFYENKHVNSDLLAVNFTELSDDEFHHGLYEANTRLIENYFSKRSCSVKKQAEDLYRRKDVSFRGFRQT